MKELHSPRNSFRNYLHVHMHKYISLSGSDDIASGDC